MHGVRTADQERRARLPDVHLEPVVENTLHQTAPAPTLDFLNFGTIAIDDLHLDLRVCGALCRLVYNVEIQRTIAFYSKQYKNSRRMDTSQHTLGVEPLCGERMCKPFIAQSP
jgi:hypothetical protein